MAERNVNLLYTLDRNFCVYEGICEDTHKERDKPPKAHKRKSKSLVSVAWISFYTFG